MGEARCEVQALVELVFAQPLSILFRPPLCLREKIKLR